MELMEQRTSWTQWVTEKRDQWESMNEFIA